MSTRPIFAGEPSRLAGRPAPACIFTMGPKSMVWPWACRQWGCVTIGIPFIGSIDPMPKSSGAISLAIVFFYVRICSARSLAVGCCRRGCVTTGALPYAALFGQPWLIRAYSASWRGGKSVI